MNDIKFEIGQEIFLSLDGGISKHTVRWHFQVKWEILYLGLRFGQSVTMNKDNMFVSLEDAKSNAIACNEEKINTLKENIESIVETQEESIELVPEEVATPVQEEIADK